ncbi:MAG: lysophospholipid acyltransferase family protein [Candidatus Brocadiia bacterium]
MSDEHADVTFLQRLQYLVLRLVIAFFLAPTWRVSRSMARILGDLVRMVDRPSRKKRMLRNLRLAFPGISKGHARRIIKKAYRSLVESIFDALYFSRFVMEGRAAELVHLEGEELLGDVDEGTGIVFATAHYGCWEVLGLSCKSLGFPVLSVARERSNPLLEKYLSRIRESAGQKLVPKHGAIRKTLKALRNGRNVAVLIDQDARKEGIFVDFFGRPACTHTSAARLAIATASPVVFIYAERIEEMNKFRAVISDVIWPKADAEREAEIRRITQRLTSDVEDLVRRNPGKWLWMHRRWKTYPGKYDSDKGRGPHGRQAVMS